MPDRRLVAASSLLGAALARDQRSASDAARGTVPARWTWATIATTTPFEVVLDNDTDPVPAENIGWAPPVGARVRAVLVAGRVLVLATIPTGTVWTPIVPPSGSGTFGWGLNGPWVELSVDLAGITSIAAGASLILAAPGTIPVPPPTTRWGFGHISGVSFGQLQAPTDGSVRFINSSTVAATAIQGAISWLIA